MNNINWKSFIPVIYGLPGFCSFIGCLIFRRKEGECFGENDAPILGHFGTINFQPWVMWAEAAFKQRLNS